MLITAIHQDGDDFGSESSNVILLNLCAPRSPLARRGDFPLATDMHAAKAAGPFTVRQVDVTISSLVVFVSATLDAVPRSVFCVGTVPLSAQLTEQVLGQIWQRLIE